MPIVCVPDSATAQAMADLEAAEPGLTVLVWSPGEPAPEGIEQVEFYVVPYSGPATSAADLARMPALKVLQVLSAGVEQWLGRRPGPLWTTPNLVITPHVGGGTDSWRPAAIRLVHAQLERYLQGQPLHNIVENGY